MHYDRDPQQAPETRCKAAGLDAPAPGRQPEPAPRTSRSTGAVVGLLLAAAVGVVALGNRDRLHGWLESPRSDEQRQHALETFLADTRFALECDEVPPAEVGAELAKLHLVPEQTRELEQAVQGGKTRLVYLSFGDIDGDSDGDRLVVQVGGLQFTTPVLSGTPWRVAIPAPLGGEASVSVTQVGGDGDGVLLGKFGATPLPVLQQGQSASFRVR